MKKHITEFLALCLLALGGCISPPETSVIPQDRVALLVDATTVQHDVTIEVNGAYAGRAQAYSKTSLSFSSSLLRDGGCIFISAHVAGGARLRSQETCLQRDDRYFTAQIQPESSVIWLNTRR